MTTFSERGTLPVHSTQSGKQSSGAAACRPALERSALRLIMFYRRYLSPLKPATCRFQPTCSHYTYQAIERFGLLQGGWMGVRRICRCTPFHRGGDDPVPGAPRLQLQPDNDTLS